MESIYNVFVAVLLILHVHYIVLGRKARKASNTKKLYVSGIGPGSFSVSEII